MKEDRISQGNVGRDFQYYYNVWVQINNLIN